MRKSLLLLAALACTGAVAQEKQVWACQGITDATGFIHADGAWSQADFDSVNYLVTIDGSNSKYGYGGREYSTNCETIDFGISHFRCNDESGGTVLLNPDTKLAVISEGLGGIMANDSRDTVSIRLFQCTKF